MPVYEDEPKAPRVYTSNTESVLKCWRCTPVQDRWLRVFHVPAKKWPTVLCARDNYNVKPTVSASLFSFFPSFYFTFRPMHRFYATITITPSISRRTSITNARCIAIYSKIEIMFVRSYLFTDANRTYFYSQLRIAIRMLHIEI